MERTCHKCGKKGHIKKDCFKWKKDKNAKDGGGVVAAVTKHAAKFPYALPDETASLSLARPAEPLVAVAFAMVAQQQIGC